MRAARPPCPHYAGPKSMIDANAVMAIDEVRSTEYCIAIIPLPSYAADIVSVYPHYLRATALGVSASRIPTEYGRSPSTQLSIIAFTTVLYCTIVSTTRPRRPCTAELHHVSAHPPETGLRFCLRAPWRLHITVPTWLSEWCLLRVKPSGDPK